ncbi:MAG: endopeptidase La [Clostridiales bacterium]|nr:endopeptidase La [Clostridiales bacterium]
MSMSERNTILEETLPEERETKRMPVIALRGLTMFPSMLLHFDVGRRASVKALDQVNEDGGTIFLVAQRDLRVENPRQSDLYEVGTICAVRQVLRLPGDNVRVMVEGLSRGRLLTMEQEKPYLAAAIEPMPEQAVSGRSLKTELYLRKGCEAFEAYCELNQKQSPDTLINVLSARNPGYMADYIAQNISLRVEDKQRVLEEEQPIERLGLMIQILNRENDLLRLEQDLEGKVQEHMNQAQKDYFLREQMKVIQAELGENPEDDDELQEYQEKIAAAKLPDEVREKLEKELRKLAKQPFGSAESSVIRNYLDVCLELPWQVKTKERVNIEAARKTLDADHYGLEKVKERILEFLAVRKLAPELGGQIICLVGPPGVGKTSIASSVAKALNRKMARVSLGGVHDEAEIRGHRKTYIGAMPGRIITAIQKAGSSNPLILLDEIDKVGSDYRGDPSSALLEVLDGEQNATFRDNFLELPFDLSDVLFITTANDMSTVPPALRDRMEVIELSSYTDEEKLQIARRHLLPKEMKRHGLDGRRFRVTDDALREIITGYTRESGVRLLERQLAFLCRKGAMELVSGTGKRVTVTGDNLEQYLGIRRYTPEKLAKAPEVGVVNGLAWTSVGGEMLQVEVNVVPGCGKVEPTGNLGEVMKESCHSAISYIRAHTAELGIEPDFYQKWDIHIHFPEGAVPKDGPSAGVTITTAIVSALTGAPVRPDVAMTGEVTLRGRVLPIGGLREKTMAAFRNGIKTVIIPADNEKDLEEIDQTVRKALQFCTAERVDTVLSAALLPVPVQKEKALTVPQPIPVSEQQPRGGDKLGIQQ